MINFVANRNVFGLNSHSKKMEIIEKGTVINPRLKKGNNCIISKDKQFYEVTVDIFKEFFYLCK